MAKTTPLTKDDIKELLNDAFKGESFRKSVRTIVNEELSVQLTDFKGVIDDALKKIQDFDENSDLYKSLHDRVLDLEDIHPDNKHNIPVASL